jgi:hypothetical protein
VKSYRRRGDECLDVTFCEVQRDGGGDTAREVFSESVRGVGPDVDADVCATQ